MIWVSGSELTFLSVNAHFGEPQRHFFGQVNIDLLMVKVVVLVAVISNMYEAILILSQERAVSFQECKDLKHFWG